MFELQKIKLVSDRVRIYSLVDCDQGDQLLRASKEIGLSIWLGLWVGEGRSNWDAERGKLQYLLGTYDFSEYNVIGVHVTSEAIYRKELTPDDVIQLRGLVKEDMDWAGHSGIPVTITDIIDTNFQYPALTQLENKTITFNQFPFWERTVNVDNGIYYMRDRIRALQQNHLAPGTKVTIAETGWADKGFREDANEASPRFMAKWLHDFVCMANSEGWDYFWFNAFDSDWQRIQDKELDGPEGHFGKICIVSRLFH